MTSYPETEPLRLKTMSFPHPSSCLPKSHRINRRRSTLTTQFWHTWPYGHDLQSPLCYPHRFFDGPHLIDPTAAFTGDSITEIGVWPINDLYAQ